MKKFISSIYALSFMLVAGATFTACSSDDAEEALPQGKQVYTLTVNASKDADTRAVDSEGNATWAVGDVVAVYKGEEKVGELTAQEAGASTTLEGEVTVDVTDVTELTLKYNTPNYDNQEGTLEYISANCDYATATISGFKVNGSSLTSTSSAEFENQQAIVKFNLNVAVTELKVNGYTVTPAAATNELYVALPAATDVTMEATAEDGTYTYEKTGANIANGSFYAFNVTMVKQATHEYVDLGLPSGTLWAKTNIGAETETESGLFFAWASTIGYTSDTSDGHLFNQANTPYYEGSAYTKYTSTDGKTVLEPEDDAATANWGSDWRMPTRAELIELYATKNNTTDYTWTWDATNKGWRITYNVNGNTLFLPAPGYRGNGSLGSAGSMGCYWSSSLRESNESSVYILFFTNNYVDVSYSGRYYGQSVRPVRAQ